MFALSYFLLAQITPPAAGDDLSVWLTQSIHWMLEQFQNRNYLPLCGVIIMVLVKLVHMIVGDKIEKKSLALLSASLGVISAVGINLISLAIGSSKTDVFAAVSNGIVVGAAASGFWNILGKTTSKGAPKFKDWIKSAFKKLWNKLKRKPKSE